MKIKVKIKLFGIIGILLTIFGFTFTRNNGIGDINNDENMVTVICSNNNIQIVVANTIIEDVVEEVSGTDVRVIVSGAEDPHSYEPSSSEVAALEDADIIFRLGLDHIEPWWESEWEDAIVVELVDASMLLEDPLLSEEETHSTGINTPIDLFEENHEDNPHVWMDPNNIKSFTSEIRDTLISEDPSNSETYMTNAANYISMLNSLIIEIEEAKELYSGIKLVVNHPAFFYLFILLDIVRVATIEKGEGKEPSAEDIASLIDDMIEQDVHLIVANPQHESDNVYEIARSTNSKIALLTPLLNVEVNWDGEQKIISTYEEMIKYDLWALGHPVDPPSILDYWWIFLILSIVVIGLAAILLIIRRRD